MSVFVEPLAEGYGLRVEGTQGGHGDCGRVVVDEGPEGVAVYGVIFDGAVDEAGGTPGVEEGGGVGGCGGGGHFEDGLGWVGLGQR